MRHSPPTLSVQEAAAQCRRQKGGGPAACQAHRAPKAFLLFTRNRAEKRPDLRRSYQMLAPAGPAIVRHRRRRRRRRSHRGRPPLRGCPPCRSHAARLARRPAAAGALRFVSRAKMLAPVASSLEEEISAGPLLPPGRTQHRLHLRGQRRSGRRSNLLRAPGLPPRLETGQRSPRQPSYPRRRGLLRRRTPPSRPTTRTPTPCGCRRRAAASAGPHRPVPGAARQAPRRRGARDRSPRPSCRMACSWRTIPSARPRAPLRALPLRRRSRGRRNRRLRRRDRRPRLPVPWRGRRPVGRNRRRQRRAAGEARPFQPDL